MASLFAVPSPLSIRLAANNDVPAAPATSSPHDKATNANVTGVNRIATQAKTKQNKGNIAFSAPAPRFASEHLAKKPAITPQEDTCDPANGTLNDPDTPNASNGLNDIPGRDASPVRWSITNDSNGCVLHLSGGTTPSDLGAHNDTPPWQNDPYSGLITRIQVEGNLTIPYVQSKIFDGLTYLNTFDTTGGTLHLARSVCAGMFQGETNLTTLTGLSNWDTSNVTDMESMFQGCHELATLDLSHFDTSNVTNISYMFQNCQALTTLSLSHFTTGKVTNMASMFQSCPELTTLSLPATFTTGKVTNMASMFSFCPKLTTLDLGSFDTGNVTDMSDMFQSCSGLTTLNLTHFATGNVTNMNNMFGFCPSLTALNLPATFATGNVTDMSKMFWGCYGLTTLDLSHFDTGNVTSMHDMFQDCYGLTTLDLSHFDTGNVTSMVGMFQSCYVLTSLNLSHFDTGNVTDMNSMFQSCYALATLDLNYFDTSNVTSMASMFNSCSALATLSFSSAFTTGKVTDMTYMFYDCGELTSIDLSHFDTGNVTSMASMFGLCSDLMALNLSTFDTRRTETTQMLPGNLPLLILGADTMLGSGSFASPSSTPWYKAGDGAHNPVSPALRIGSNDDLTSYTGDETQAAGVYVRSNPWTVKLCDTSVTPHPCKTAATGNTITQPRWTVPSPDTVILDNLQHISNPNGKLFDTWVTHDDGTGTTYAPGSTMWVPGGTTTLYTKWHTAGNASISKAWWENTSDPKPVKMPVSFAGSNAGDTLRACIKPKSQLQGYNSTQCSDITVPQTGTTPVNETLQFTLDRFPDIGKPYEARLAWHDPKTGNDAWACDALDATLPYTTADFQDGKAPDGTPAWGTTPAAVTTLTDHSSGDARLNLPLPDGIYRPAHYKFLDWATATGTGAWHPGQAIPVNTSKGDTDADGHTIIHLTAQWALVDKPTNLTLAQDASTGGVILSVTDKPWSTSDQLRITLTPAAGPQRTWTLSSNTVPVDWAVTSVVGAWDGTNDQTWTKRFNAGELQNGNYTITATLTSRDNAYSGTANVDSEVANSGTIRLTNTNYIHAMPFTGGAGRKAAIFIAFAAALTILIAATARATRRHSRHAR
ncbi:BspA family leucine-rich repeat surface protein [Bifidobacterium sp. ESL0775]|uniref:BspA family leucine-rich repeat surface protein n=1 Tax=Bifidobacterium sp. ESL0775 TaxID=2983230 RepID=UPI0023F8FA4A|nr:BspA family leucine-rich repeat surface protein [Bifidobacterium sp. ESL0775]WEV69482.1 BspA family leucine-rich repeat surface protein [Bifidobacterium sp. ESL0775]